MKKPPPPLAVAWLLMLAAGTASAANCTSTASGNWTNPGIWSCGLVPGTGDNVTIANLNHTVVITDARRANTLTFTGGVQPATLQIQNGGSLRVNGNATINAPTAAVTKLIQLQAVSSLTVGGTLDLNGGGGANRFAEVRVEGGSSLTVAGSITLSNNPRSRLNFLAAGILNLGRHMRQTGTFSCPACTVNFTGGQNQDIAGTPSGYTYFNIVDQKTGNAAIFFEDTTINGSITDNGGLDLLNGGPPIVTLGGASVQAINGLAAVTTFDSLIVAQAAGGSVTLSHDIYIASALTLTTGIINGGSSKVILDAAATLSGGSASSYVSGCIQKNLDPGQTLNFRAAGRDEFPVGLAGSYLPVEITAGRTSTAGNLVVCVTAGDHPQMTIAAGGGIDTSKSLNRYWSMTSTTLNTTAALVDAIFKFPNGASEYDAGAAPANFIVERFNGTLWSPTTLVAAGATSTRARNINLTAGINAFAIGEPLPGFTASPGRFNAFETSTPAGSLIGRIFTKLAGANFALDIISINASRTALGGAVTNVTVNLLDSSNNSGALNVATGCRATWTFVQCLAGGAGGCPQGAINIPAAGRVTLNNINAARARREARIQVVRGGTTACSTDRFSIRPGSFAVTSTNATNITSGGAPAFKTGASFNLTATAIAGYDGTPALDNAKVVGTPNPGTIGGAFGAAPVATGIATGSAFTYSEVGNFGLQTDAVTDASFTSADPANDCTADTSSAPVGGKYGCVIGSTAVAPGTGLGFGRFIPDHFFLAGGSTLTNRSAAACAPPSTFSYLGEGMALAFTLQARNTALAVTQNYAGAYAKLNPATIAQLGLGASSGTTNLTSRLDLSAGSAGSFAAGQAAVTATVGVARAVPDNPDGPFTATKIGVAPSDSDGVTARTADLNVDVDGVGGNDHVQVGGDTELRFGRLRLQNALGSEKLALPVPIETQYWSGGAFVTNTLDSCTSIPRSAVALGSYSGALSPAPNCLTFVQQNPITFSSGVGTLALAAPSGGASGSLLLTPNLGTATAGSFCSAAGVAPTSPATAAGLGYLLGRWDDAANPDANANTSYDDKPSARAAFGLYGSQPGNFIYFRENY